MMVLLEKTSRPSGAASSRNVPEQQQQQQRWRPQSLPSPALCCACGLCIMLAGINITLVGAFAFGTFVPTSNVPIIVGPLLLLLALAFFTTCCVISRRAPAAHAAAHLAKGGSKWGLMRMRMGTATFEMETSEHTLQDTTAVQFSPTNSPTSSSSSSHKACSSQGAGHAGAGGELLHSSSSLHMSEMCDLGVTGDAPETLTCSDGNESVLTQMLPAAQNSSSPTT